jgi:3-deoxy-D-manno-octulosonate 8-phosphate phosphatase (KDO 8-P phosphatase)
MMNLGEKYDHVWFVTNVTFDPDLPLKLAESIGSHAAIHPKFKSDHKHMTEGEGVKEVPFVEFTAPLVRADVFKDLPLDENLPYWAHDLDWGYRVWSAGYSIAVNYDLEVGHTYIRHSKMHPVTKERLRQRRAADQPTREALVKKYGAEWRDIIFPKDDKAIGKFYANVGAKIANKAKRSEMKVICCDLDGVLTDGKVWVNHQGEIIKGFNSRDLTAIKELIANGYEFHIITASSWSGAYAYLKKSGAVLHTIRNKEEIPFTFDIAIGDSAWDVPMFRKAKECFCPADAALEVRTLDGMNVMETKGGEGVILELARELCTTRNGLNPC